jgi:uncharacterized protein with ParB-like and HNH nuclease domain
MVIMSIDKVLKIEGSSITWTCKQVAKMVEKETMNFKNVIQRSFVWERHRMSELIWSIIMGFPIPPLYAERGEANNDKVKIYDVLDGQQRSTTIYRYLNDGFALTELKPIPYLNEEGEECSVDISGKKFSELDEELQDIIKDATITVKYYDNLTQSDKAEMFRRLNNGKPLTTKAKTIASTKDIESLLDVGSHQLFQEMLTNKARANKNQAVISAKVLIMLTNNVENISFASKDFNPIMEQMEVSDDEKLALAEVFDYIVNAHEELISNQEKDVAKKLYTEVHLVSLIPYVKQSIDEDISISMFAEFLINFFKTENDSEEYDEYINACTSGIARNSTIVARDSALGKSYEKFFANNKEKVEITS